MSAMSDESASRDRAAGPGGESSAAGHAGNLWAPWRMEYIDSLASPQEDGCFLCRYRDEPEKDESNLVLRRGERAFAVLNRFPYAAGHALVAPYEHVAGLADLDGQTMQEMMELLRDLQTLLARVIRAQGFNIGMNVGRCAGAGLPGHLHAHIVPRWSGDVNFMTVLGEVRVIPQALDDLYARLRRPSAEPDPPKSHS